MQTLRHPEMAKLFAAKGGDFLSQVDAMERKIDRQANDPRVTRAYMLVAPLLFETVAISQFVDQQPTPSLRAGLPELTTISEAVDLAMQEFRLSQPQQASLTGLLKDGFSR